MRSDASGGSILGKMKGGPCLPEGGELEMTGENKLLSEASRVSAEAFRGRCIGCRDCTGVCRALLEMLSVPGTVLRRGG